jgi:cholesterol oxidase
MRVLRWQAGPFLSDALSWRRALKTLAGFVLHPLQSTASQRTGRRWAERSTVLLTMQAVDNELSLRFERGLLGWRLRSRVPAGQARAPTYLPAAQRIAQTFAQVSAGTPGNALPETLLGASATAHVLGGCVMGDGPAHGVVDESGEVFGHPGLHVIDGSVYQRTWASIPASPSRPWRNAR